MQMFWYHIATNTGPFIAVIYGFEVIAPSQCKKYYDVSLYMYKYAGHRKSYSINFRPPDNELSFRKRKKLKSTQKPFKGGIDWSLWELMIFLIQRPGK